MARSQTPALYDYLKKYQEDPTSRVFAPLAESYRKSGMLDEAIEIAREGLRMHPNFVGGRVALARALFDKQLYDEVIQELASIIQDAPDNLVAQRLLAESYLIRGRVMEALGCYKMLLYFNPSDAEIAQLVKELESQAYDQGTAVLRTDLEFSIQDAPAALAQDPGRRRKHWIEKIEKLQSMLQHVERYRFTKAADRI